MHRGYSVLSAGLVAVFAAAAATAHHGFGTFLMDEDVELTGTVTGLDFVNPHSWLYLDVAQDDGTVAAFRCEMRSANTLRRSGWTPELFPMGEEVRISGSPDRDDPYSCYVSTVIFDDGSSIDRYGQISAPADIGQGQRPLTLSNGEPNISGDWAREQRVMTDPRGQYGTLVPLSEVDEIRATGDLEAAGAIQGARGTERAAEQAAAARAAREGDVPETAAPAAAGPGRVGGPGPGGRAGGAGRGFAGRGGGSALTEAGAARLAALNLGDRYETRCIFTNIATEWAGDEDEVVNRIVQRGDTITLLYGRLSVERTIHLNMDAHPDNIEPSLTGHSIGHWDDGVLVVDTIGFTPGLYNTSTPHSAELHVVEEFSLDAETGALTRSYTATDPLYWTGEQTGTNTKTPSNVAFFDSACADLTVDEDVELGPRD